jgi:hypothetical protein
MMINALTNNAVDKIEQHQRDTLGRARAAKPAELTAGAIVNDREGTAIARIEQVDADGVVVSSGTARVKVPADAFGHNKVGLLLDMSKGQFDQIVAQANTHN